ncbi:hypothetical protein E4634_00600 [Mangrovimicrobium sediminis]|uniref:Uncharacterized protein n=1 Tax=Mangrovimicrobium sediminis TaxID=2562682 RepID=A0A4Z0M9C2_9GAMM|nr:IPT/TIG domain-containing protein [Haliea sp. SAOS-164]TGD76084.1 hypothetical protein E4634_00600 [Haliea sp. SAOS-164]
MSLRSSFPAGALRTARTLSPLIAGLGLALGSLGAGAAQLAVELGHGSGNYAAGETVYIAANTSDLLTEDDAARPEMPANGMQRIFAGWTGDAEFLDDPLSPRTSILMPDHPVSVSATYKDVSPWITPSVLTYFPPEHHSVIFFFHGIESCSWCLARRPTAEVFIEEAVSRGFGVIVPEKFDPLDDTWDSELEPSANFDMQRMSALRHDLVARGVIHADEPVHLVGVSAGGYFASLFDESAQAELDFPVTTMTLMLSPGYYPKMTETRVPTLLAQARNDSLSTLEMGVTAHNLLLQRGVAAQMVVGRAMPVYPEYFAAVDGVTATASREIVAALDAGGFLDSAGFLRDNPRTSGWEQVLPPIEDLAQTISDIRSMMFQAYAEHSIMDGFAHRVFEFIEQPVARVDYAPRVIGFEPATGTEGTPVTIHGEFFVDVQAVEFNGQPTTFVQLTGDQLVAYVPQGVSAGPISVTNSAGDGVSTGNFGVLAAEVDSMEPASGRESTVVVISGSGLVDVTGVTFNGLAASFTEISAGKLTASVPKGATDGPVLVNTASTGGIYAGEFDVLPPPSVSGLSTDRAMIGDLVSIYGDSLGDTTDVLLNGSINAPFTVISDSEVVFEVPANAQKISGIRVFTPYGSISAGSIYCKNCSR